MALPKPTWLVYAVDFAQIGSAFFTAGAVMTAIWLARRNEAQRLRFFVTRSQTIIVGAGEGRDEMALVLTIVNAGLLPVQLRHAIFNIEDKSGSTWGLGLAGLDAAKNRKNFPLTLAHGEQVVLEVPINRGTYPWNAIDRRWWPSSKPRFIVSTSLGRNYMKKPDYKTMRNIQANWLA